MRKSNPEVGSAVRAERPGADAPASVWRRYALVVDKADAETAAALLGTTCGVATSAAERACEDGNATAVRVCAYVPLARADRCARELRERLRALRQSGMFCNARLRRTTVVDRDWATSWKRFFRPFEVAAGLYVVPSWETEFSLPAGARRLLLDPGMAFGTGQHATTKMALALSLPHVSGKVVLDIGCGSGILGIGAALRGARVYASDNDPIAVAATRFNYDRNGLEPKAVRRAAGVPCAFPHADVIMANITGEVLAGLAQSFAQRLRAGGIIVTSGLTRRTSRMLLAAFAAAGLRPLSRRAAGEWLAYVHRKPGRQRLSADG
ncbi:MAG: 50S ribosomal protein L11 methyltransferase [Candidatus Eremiobacteraeota bacterium]|nr:50S ribosomal protein L11 methyltransferase [Candidatus Eremiobacteraeota bacterium]